MLKCLNLPYILSVSHSHFPATLQRGREKNEHVNGRKEEIKQSRMKDKAIKKVSYIDSPHTHLVTEQKHRTIYL